MQQVLKNGLIEFSKSTKGDKNNIHTVRFSNGNYWIYDGLILNTNCYNMKFAVNNNKVLTSKIPKNEVFIISGTISDERKHLFNI